MKQAGAQVHRNPRRRIFPPKGSREYRQLWRIIDGAVRDAFVNHPEYLAPRKEKTARQSIVKRVAGAIEGYSTQKAEQGRSGKEAGG